MSAKDTPARRAAVKAATFEALTGKKPVEKVIYVLLDPAMAQRLDEARDHLSLTQSRARLQPNDEEVRAEADAALLAVGDARDAAAESTVALTFRAIGRLKFDDLISHHPPTEEQKAKNYGWNPTTFSPALVSASLADPKLSVDEVNQLLSGDAWNNAEATELFNTALEVNNSRRTADLGKD